MIIVRGNKTAYFDVDDTLVLWNPTYEQECEFGIEIEYSGSISGINGTSAILKGMIVPHQKHIQQMRNHKLRGHLVVVWSAGGCEWAETIVKALGLEEYVDLVICKPTWAYDDKNPEEYMPKSQWMEDK